MGAGILNIASALQNMNGVPPPPFPVQQGPTAPAPPTGPAANAPSQSPVHDFVRQTPGVTAQAVQTRFPLLSLQGAQAVIDSVRGSQPPVPQSPVAQARAPVAPSAPPPPSMNAFTTPGSPGYIPAPPAAQFPASVMPAPPQASAPPPGAPASTPGTQTPTGYPPDMQNRLTLQNNAATQPPGTFPTDSAPSAPPAAPSMTPSAPSGQPSWLRGAERFLPAALVALASRNNPQVGASILQGYDAGQQQKQALEAQQRQQAFENQQVLAKTAQEQQQQQFSNRNDFNDALLKRDAAGQQQMVNALSDADAKALGIDKAAFYGPDGKFIPQTSAEKPLDPVALARVQAANYDKLQGLTPESQQNIHDSMDEGEWKATYGVPYDNFAPVQRQKDVTDAQKATTAQQKVDDAAKLIAPKIAQINAQAGLSKSRTTYYNLTTPQKVKIYQQTARLLGLKADDQKDLDTAKMAYEKALGGAATSNAESNAFNAETKAELTQAQIHKLAAETRGTEARIQQVATKDPYFAAMVSLRDNANDLKAKALANTGYDAPTRARIIAGYDADIKRADDYIQSRMSGNGTQNGPPPDTSQAPVVGNPALQGKQTPRSAAWNNRGVSVTPSPAGARLDAVAKAVQSSGLCNGRSNCEAVARTTYQRAFGDAYNQYFDRGPNASALSTLKNFQKAGLAQPYDPSQPVPAGSLLYSSTMGKGNGHVQIVGSDGTRYDQYGKNRFSPSSFDYFVPPPAGRSGAPASVASAPLAPTGRLSTGITYKVLP
jgi:hypothetical protein